MTTHCPPAGLVCFHSRPPGNPRLAGGQCVVIAMVHSARAMGDHCPPTNRSVFHPIRPQAINHRPTPHPPSGPGNDDALPSSGQICFHSRPPRGNPRLAGGQCVVIAMVHSARAMVWLGEIIAGDFIEINGGDGIGFFGMRTGVFAYGARRVLEKGEGCARSADALRAERGLESVWVG